MRKILLVIVTGISLGFLLWGKWQLGLTRYFDADELAYLHWAHNVFAGRVPYIDFFFYVPPGFLWFLSGIYAFFGGTTVLVVSRVLAFSIFVGMCGASGLIFVCMRGTKGIWGSKGDWGERIWLFLLPGIILSFLPLPADKMLEIRPDNLAIFIGLIGLLCQIRGKAFWAGFFYSVSLLVLPKTLPQVALALLLFPSVPLFVGLALPMALFGIWILGIGDFSMVWYSLTRLPLEVNRIGEVFFMQPDLFFYPNATYYGVGGVSRGLIANHSVWIIGLLMGGFRLITGTKPKHFLVPGMLFVSILMFLYGYPLRHAQYLIPIAVFVSLYAADLLVVLEKRVGVLGVIGVFGAMIVISFEVNKPKLAWTNAEDKRILQTAIDTIPKNSYVFDLVGATIYFRDPYYVSGLPFGQYEPYLSRKLPSLEEALDTTQTPYIYEGRLGRIGTLPSKDQTYILKRYDTSSTQKIYHRR